MNLETQKRPTRVIPSWASRVSGTALELRAGMSLGALDTLFKALQLPDDAIELAVLLTWRLGRRPNLSSSRFTDMLRDATGMEPEDWFAIANGIGLTPEAVVAACAAGYGIPVSTRQAERLLSAWLTKE